MEHNFVRRRLKKKKEKKKLIGLVIYPNRVA